MEEDIHIYQGSPISKTTVIVEERLKLAIEKASEKIDYESAHNPELLRALKVVEKFIKDKKRICYGGTAMNAILPESKKFYNPKTDLPDYDFYTPALDEDVLELVEILNKEGFNDVYHKVGMHEGTKKILVNFIAVADVSAITPELFAIMFRRSIVKESVHYTDPNVLRMMMYLELSRPKGEVERWTKVFERLQLIEEAFPIKGCKRDTGQYQAPVSLDMRKAIIEYCINNQRILCNGSLDSIYGKGIRQGHTSYDIRVGGPLLFTSPDPKGDAKAVKDILKDDSIKMYLHVARGELVPLRIELRMGDKPVCMFIEETACHSYNTVPVGDQSIHIGSLEFLITLYLSIDIFTNHSKDYLGDRIMCQVKKFIDLAKENYSAKRSQFPPFALECGGHQTGYASLLRAKVMRIQKERANKTVKKKKKTKKVKKVKT